jgi:hypothetical protein
MPSEKLLAIRYLLFAISWLFSQLFGRCRRPFSLGDLLAHRFKEAVELGVGGGLKESAADGRQRPADLHLSVNAHLRLPFGNLLQGDDAVSLDKTDRTFRLHDEPITLWELLVGQADGGGKAPLDRTDPDRHRRQVSVVARRFHLLAAGDALGDDVRVSQRLPDQFPFRFKLPLTLHFHLPSPTQQVIQQRPNLRKGRHIPFAHAAKAIAFVQDPHLEDQSHRRDEKPVLRCRLN